MCCRPFATGVEEAAFATVVRGVGRAVGRGHAAAVVLAEEVEPFRGRPRLA